MKIKLDENLPEALVAVLSEAGHDVDNVRQEGLAGCDDGAVWQAAQEDGRFPVTQDLDFSDRSRFASGTHHGLLLVRLREAGRLALTSRLAALFRDEPVETWARCFVVLSDRKLRISRPRNG